MKSDLSFSQAVLELIKQVPPGKLVSYSQLAKLLGKPGAARAVGNALHRNAQPVVVPCHRVVAENGGLGGYANGPAAKRALLQKEGVYVNNNRVVNWPQLRFTGFKLANLHARLGLSQAKTGLKQAVHGK